MVGQALNASRTGIYVATELDVPDVDKRVTIRMAVRHIGKLHVVMFTARVVRHRDRREKPGTHHGFAAQFLVVDELGHPGIFSHFLQSHLN